MRASTRHSVPTAARATFALLMFSLGACAPELTGEQRALCDVRQQLVGAFNTTRDALTANAAGDVASARAGAEQARADARDASDKLFQMESGDEVAAWQALLGADEHIWHGALTLLPGFESGPGATEAALGEASNSLARADNSMRFGCGSGFTIGAPAATDS